MSTRRLHLDAVSNPAALAVLWVAAIALAFPAGAFVGLFVLFMPVLLLSFVAAPVTSLIFGPELAGDPFVALAIAAPASIGVALGVVQATFLRDVPRSRKRWVGATTVGVFGGFAACLLTLYVVSPVAPRLAANLAGGVGGMVFGAAQFWGLRIRQRRSAAVWLAGNATAAALISAALPVVQSAMATRMSASGLVNTLYMGGLALGVGALLGLLTLPLLFYARISAARNRLAAPGGLEVTAQRRGAAG